MQDTFKARDKRLKEAMDLLLSMDNWALSRLSNTLSTLLLVKRFNLSIRRITEGNRWDVNFYKPEAHSFTDTGKWCHLSDYVQVSRETCSANSIQDTEVYYVGIQDMLNDRFSSADNARLVKKCEIKGVSDRLCKR